MNDIFVDTSGWASYFDSREPSHKSATQIYRDVRLAGFKIVTTNYVITELIALLASPLRLPRGRIITFVEGVTTSPYVEVVHIDEELHRQAWTLLKARQDKDWSLVDCSSFVLMEELGITQALTADHHFEQAGFVGLLKLKPLLSGSIQSQRGNQEHRGRGQDEQHRSGKP